MGGHTGAVGAARTDACGCGSADAAGACSRSPPHQGHLPRPVRMGPSWEPSPGSALLRWWPGLPPLQDSRRPQIRLSETHGASSEAPTHQTFNARMLPKVLLTIGARKILEAKVNALTANRCAARLVGSL